jgi:carboxylesterase type B
LGFLALGTREVPGNAGMKGQVLALKWVRNNIEKFGGNKNQITIAGYSAGAFSVTSHMASSMSKNLFHRAIAMSGSITTTMPLESDNKEISKKLGKLLNCKTTKLIECLKKVKFVTKFH